MEIDDMWNRTQLKITKARGMMIYDVKITNDIISYRRLPSILDREESMKENLSGQNNIERKLSELLKKGIISITQVQSSRYLSNLSQTFCNVSILSNSYIKLFEETIWLLQFNNFIQFVCIIFNLKNMALSLSLSLSSFQ